MSRLRHRFLVLAAGLLALAGCEGDNGVREDPERPTFTLAVDTENPDGGVSIGVTPSDVDGKSDGESPFERTYEEDAAVTLTAPKETAEGHPFSHWEVDGEAAGEAHELTLELGTDREARAVFSNVWTLTVTSESPESGVPIDVAPEDRAGEAAGTTSFERHYVDGTDIQLAAPEASEGNAFLRWELDEEPIGEERELAFSMSDDHTAMALYSTSTTLTVASEGPDEGITVRAAPADAEGTEESVTPFSLNYLIGQQVELRPEALTSDGRYFRAWTYDGPAPSGTQAIILEVSRGATATAHYAEAAAAVDTTYEVGGRPRGLPENEMYRTLELDVLSEEAIEEDRVGVFYGSAEGLLALPHDTEFDLSGDGAGDTPARLFYDLEPGRLTLCYRADTDTYVHPAWLPEHVVVVIFEEQSAPLAMTENP